MHGGRSSAGGGLQTVYAFPAVQPRLRPRSSRCCI